jgi:hypothetical protein
MSAIAVSPARPARTPIARVTDPAYSALTLAAGSMLFLGTESTVSVSTLRLLPRQARAVESPR